MGMASMKNNLLLSLSALLLVIQIQTFTEEIPDTIISNRDIINRASDSAIKTPHIAQFAALTLPTVGISSILLAAGIFVGYRLNKRLIRIENHVRNIQPTLDREFPEVKKEIRKVQTTLEEVHQQLQGLSTEQKKMLIELLKTHEKVTDIQKNQTLQTPLLLTLSDSVKNLPTKEFISNLLKILTEKSA